MAVTSSGRAVGDVGPYNTSRILREQRGIPWEASFACGRQVASPTSKRDVVDAVPYGAPVILSEQSGVFREYRERDPFFLFPF